MTPTEPINSKVKQFFHKGRLQKFRKGEIIMRAGDTPQGIYLTEKGLIKVYALSKQGNEHVHMYFMPGDIFPLMYAFKDAVRNVFYQAAEDSEVWLVSKDKFLEFAASDADVTMDLLTQAVDMFRLYAGRIDNLLYAYSDERTVYRLLSFIERMGEIQPDGTWIVRASITHADIASSINLSRETVSRCIEKLRKKGIIGPNIPGVLLVKDLPALAKIIGIDEVIGMWPQFEPYLT